MIRAKFTSADLSKMMNERAKRIESAIILRLSKIGEQCVNVARSSSDYTDRTGNLRSSIGYAVMADGKIISQYFEKGNGTDGQKGVDEAASLVQQLSSRFATGYALIVVAGMDYAYYVEATGRDVLSSAEHYAETQLPRMLKELTQKI